MDVFTFKFTAYGLLLVLCLCQFGRATDSKEPTTKATSTITGTTQSTTATDSKELTTKATSTITGTTQPTTTQKPPEDVKNVTVVDQTETSVKIRFDKVDGVNKYNLYYFINETDKMEHISWDANNPVLHTLYHLLPARKYNMTLCSILGDLRSKGYSFNATTAPVNVAEFKAMDQNESSITLKWTKKTGVPHYILTFDGNKKKFTEKDSDIFVVTNLTSRTVYSFTLYSEFEDIRSTGFNLTEATAPSSAKDFKGTAKNETSIMLQWTNENLNYILRFNDTDVNFMAQELGYPAQYNVTGLQSATTYNFTLITVFHNLTGIEVDISVPTVPRDATGFKVQKSTETSINLQWNKVDNILHYELKYGTFSERVTASSETVVTHNVTNLQSGTLYSFTLYTEYANLSSRGILHEASTVPLQVSSVDVTERNLTTITLRWKSVRKDWNYLVDFNGSTNKPIPDGDFVTCTVRSLKPGSVYLFSIVTEFQMLNSTPFQNNTATVIDCTTVDWQVTETSIRGIVEGVFTDATASNGSLPPHHNSGPSNEIRFTDLYPGANYSMTLLYKGLVQCNHALTIIPPSLEAKCKNWDAGYSIYIEWNRPSGVWDSVEVNVANEVYTVKYNDLYTKIPHFQPAKKYKVSISTLSGTQRSKEFVFTCATDARGVIAGAFFGVFLFAVLVCVVVFIMIRRPDIISKHKKSLNGISSTSVKKWIPLDKFPRHFNELSADENKGFSLEYEDLAIVGTEQSQKAATVQENKPKNRFINVLPYDHSRVKLPSSSPHNDYINANYMPGYNSNSEFIAAQGPLPSTVNDFWRMIWEQKVSGIVMVTNCTEGGRTKCEQYWPDSRPQVRGDLEVSTTSEQKEPDWTLREFKVKHRRTSEERTVKHFHFTAWPDHGVPQGTQVLIQFRALVRRHMQTEAAGTPTVVHCSAGVGRTGTIIALDVLMQQMEKEKAVDINGFVQKMRIHRPHMVQTESQYVFLHQCILDILLLNEKPEEHIYENELIYANATALREFENNMNNA